MVKLPICNRPCVITELPVIEEEPVIRRVGLWRVRNSDNVTNSAGQSRSRVDQDFATTHGDLVVNADDEEPGLLLCSGSPRTDDGFEYASVNDVVGTFGQRN